MKAKERRERILDIVKNSDAPVPANKLASEFDVSRQIIVQDIAVIRAADDGIIATNRGQYLTCLRHKTHTTHYYIFAGILARLHAKSI